MHDDLIIKTLNWLLIEFRVKNKNSLDYLKWKKCMLSHLISWINILKIDVDNDRSENSKILSILQEIRW